MSNGKVTLLEAVNLALHRAMSEDEKRGVVRLISGLVGLRLRQRLTVFQPFHQNAQR